MAVADHLARVEVESLAEWRAWLHEHHSQSESVWLVTWKKGAGPYVPRDDLVDEALCFGWIDSLPRRLDEGRTMLLMSPRRKGSRWSAVNRAKIERLRAEVGRLQLAGLARVEEAKSDGSWASLDDVEALVMPPDLAAALGARAEAGDRFQAFSRSSRRGILEWLSTARTAETRAKRIAEIAALAEVGLRANFPVDRAKWVALQAKRG